MDEVETQRQRGVLSVAIKLWIAANGGRAHWKMFDILRTCAAREHADPIKAEEVAVRRMWIAIWHCAEGLALDLAADKAGCSLTTAKADKRALESAWLQLREDEEPWRPDTGEAA